MILALTLLSNIAHGYNAVVEIIIVAKLLNKRVGNNVQVNVVTVLKCTQKVMILLIYVKITSTKKVMTKHHGGAISTIF